MQLNNQERTVKVNDEPLSAREDQEKDQNVQDGLNLVIKLFVLAILIITINRLIK